MKKKFMIFGAVAAMTLGLVGCASAPPLEKVDEVYSAVLALQDSVDAYAAARTASDVEPEPVEVDDPFSALTEENLLPFVEFSDLVVMQRAVDDVAASEDEDDADDTVPDEETGVSVEEPDGVPDENDEITIDDVDPMGYLRSIRVYDSDVAVFGEYDDEDVDVAELGEYEITFLITVDRDAYDTAVNDFDGTEAMVEDADDPIIECIETPEVPTPQIVEIKKTVRVVDEITYNDMIESDVVTEIVPWTAKVSSSDGGESDVISEIDFVTDGSAGIEDSNVSDPLDPTSVVATALGDEDHADVGSSGTNRSPAPAESTGSGGSPSVSAAPSQPAHTHNWVTETVSDGHYETVQTGTTTVQSGTRTVVDSEAWTETLPGKAKCLVCGTIYSDPEDWVWYDECDGGYTVIPGDTVYHPAITHEEPVYSEQPVYSDVWVDTSYTVTTCSICGQRQ